MVNRTVVGGNQIPMLRHTLQKRKKKKKITRRSWEQVTSHPKSPRTTGNKAGLDHYSWNSHQFMRENFSF